MDSNMTFRIVDSRTYYDANGNRVGTTYSVFCEDEDGSSVVEVNVDGDQDTLSPEPQASTPPEAYAAFVRLYIEWMEMTEEEQVEYTRKSVKYAGFNHKKHAYSDGKRFAKSGDELYDEEFDGYVNEAWASLGERFTDVDAFAIYLEKNLDRYCRFPMSGDMLRRAAQNMMSHKNKEYKLNHLSLNSSIEDGDGDEHDFGSNIPDSSFDVSEIIKYSDFLKQINHALAGDPVAKVVFDLIISGYKKGEIAKFIQKQQGKPNPCNSLVSRKMEKIKEIVVSIVQ